LDGHPENNTNNNQISISNANQQRVGICCWFANYLGLIT